MSQPARIEHRDAPLGYWEAGPDVRSDEIRIAEPTLAAAHGAGVMKVVIGRLTWVWHGVATGGNIVDQPPPVRNDSKPIWELVMADMEERDHVGRQRYGTPLQAFNGRDPLVDAYQEALDLVVYLRQAIEERGEQELPDIDDDP